MSAGIRAALRPLVIFLTTALAGAAFESAVAQQGYYAAIAYSQSTGNIGYTARQARTELSAQQYAMRNCNATDAKTYIWGPNQWVAIATVDGVKGTAGFGRGTTDAEAQQKALAECGKRAGGRAYHVALCVHSSGQRARLLQRVAATAPQATPTGYVAAIAFSPSTGKIGRTAGNAKTREEAEKIALADCGEKDAKVFMWSEQWAAIAVADNQKGVAGFGPGVTREAAEKAALEQCRKFSKGAPCHVALAVFSAGEQKQTVAKPAVPAGSTPAAPAPALVAPGASSPPAVAPATSAPATPAAAATPAPAAN